MHRPYSQQFSSILRPQIAQNRSNHILRTICSPCKFEAATYTLLRLVGVTSRPLSSPVARFLFGSVLMKFFDASSSSSIIPRTRRRRSSTLSIAAGERGVVFIAERGRNADVTVGDEAQCTKLTRMDANF